MEERVAGGAPGAKDKKYVLYTVVGEDRVRTTPGGWMLRVLLGSLLVAALAVVPYVSLRLAQGNSRTLVVFQPVPVHNRSLAHHGMTHRHPTGTIRGRPVNLMHVADLTLENYTAPLNGSQIIKSNNSITEKNSTVNPTSTNAVILITSPPMTNMSKNTSFTVSLIKSNVTVVVLDDKKISFSETPEMNTSVSSTKTFNASSTTVKPVAETSTDTSEQVTVLTTVVEIKKTGTETETTASNGLTSLKPTSHPSSPTINLNITTATAKSTSSIKTTTITTALGHKRSLTTTASNSSIIRNTTTATNISMNTTKSSRNPNLKSSKTTAQKTLSHKLVYVATSTSGNHVGGICVWKVDKNITNWSYFYDNVPIEFQSGHDTGDHELRATLAAVRTWSGMWQDAHATLRSQHNAIEHSDLAVRKVLIDELEKLSDGHFTYELEWRLPEADTLVKISNSLSRLHQDYKFWFTDFKAHVEQLLGKQDWKEVVKHKHVKVAEEAFFTDENYDAANEISVKIPSNTSTETNALSTNKPKTEIVKPLSHKLVYVATSASGNHVGGFCMWKLDKNVTNWSYFYDNIPIEYQSNHDSADHEQRATLAAVRVWANRWQDSHVTLRSQHAAIERSDSYIRKILVETLDNLSDGHFTYDLEWRLRKSDNLVKISYGLSRLHRNFAHWYAVFKASVDDALGPQDWETATEEKRVRLADVHFFTKESQGDKTPNSLESTLVDMQR